MGERGWVRRRRVLFIPGFDPAHPRRFRELYRREGAAQAAISGYALALAPRRGGGPFGWRVTARIDGAEVEAEVEVLQWSDIVRASMDAGLGATYAQMARTAWIYVGSGALPRLARLGKGPVAAALYPVAMLLLQALLALLAGLLAGSLLLRLAGEPPGGRLLALLVAGGVGWGVLALFRRHDDRLLAHYLMHDFAFAARDRGRYPPELEARLCEFRARVSAALDARPDEVLVVGHSSGAHLGVSVLAGLLRERSVPPGTALGFLSLGQVVPMMSFLPEAHGLRADLADLAARPDLAWVDVTAPGDGCAFALCDPVAVSGVAPAGQRWPLVVSAAFTRTLSPERWRRLRWRFLRLHFQYLHAFDRPGDFDYFRITAGPLTLGERFRARAPSPGRIARPLSGHTGVAASS